MRKTQKVDQETKLTVTLYGITPEDREKITAVKKRLKAGLFYRDAILEKIDREQVK